MNKADFKNKILKKVAESQQDKLAFKEIEEEINKKFFSHRCVYEELTFLIWDIPKQKDDEEKVKRDIEKAFIPEMAVLTRNVKKEHNVKHNFVQVTGAFDEQGDSVVLMFGKDENDPDGVMVTLEKK